MENMDPSEVSINLSKSCSFTIEGVDAVDNVNEGEDKAELGELPCECCKFLELNICSSSLPGNDFGLKKIVL